MVEDKVVNKKAFLEQTCNFASTLTTIYKMFSHLIDDLAKLMTKPFTVL